MSLHSPFPFCALLVALIAGCGGAASESLPEDATLAAASDARPEVPRLVQLEGCAADQYEVPRTGTTVRVLSTDGGLLGHAVSDRDGIFRLLVRPNQTVQLAVERDDSQRYEVPVGTSNLSVSTCLNDRET